MKMVMMHCAVLIRIFCCWKTSVAISLASTVVPDPIRLDGVIEVRKKSCSFIMSPEKRHFFTIHWSLAKRRPSLFSVPSKMVAIQMPLNINGHAVEVFYHTIQRWLHLRILDSSRVQIIPVLHITKVVKVKRLQFHWMYSHHQHLYKIFNHVLPLCFPPKIFHCRAGWNVFHCVRFHGIRMALALRRTTNATWLPNHFYRPIKPSVTLKAFYQRYILIYQHGRMSCSIFMKTMPIIHACHRRQVKDPVLGAPLIFMLNVCVFNICLFDLPNWF